MAFEIVELELFRHPRLLRRLGAIRRRITTGVGPLRVEVATTPEPVPFARRAELTYRPARPGTTWGKAFTCAWFHVTGRVPAGVGPHVALLLDTDGEAVALDRHGRLVGALTSRVSPVEQVGTARGKTRLDVNEAVAPGGDIDLWLDTGFNGKLMPPFGTARVKRLALVRWDDEVAVLYDDYLVCCYAHLAADGALADRYRAALDTAWHAWNTSGDGSGVAAARQALAPLLAGTPDASLRVEAVGHGHLDLAWLWPVRETKRKARRTLTAQLDLLDRHPGYTYGVSQPQQLAWLEEEHPDLFERVRGAVADGRIEPQGGMWVEPDTNLPSGESLVRQVVMGQRYWQSRFDRTLSYCWLPDVFGYSAALPQILRQGGMDSFLTIKLSWNEHNDFPHRSFTWEGLDGSRVLVHMPPEGSYNSSATPLALAALARQYPERTSTDRALMVYGSGDGGGGPGPAHFAMLDRTRSLEGFPSVRPSSAGAFFEGLRTVQDRLPVHRGELYLEKHQGTYTTQAENKRGNRHTEHLLHDTEYLATLAWSAGERDWPGDLLERSWRRTLLLQFHDILPGSSIERVHREARDDYARLETELGDEQRAVLEPTAVNAAAPAGPHLVNTRPVTRRGYTRVGGRWFGYEAQPFTTVALQEWGGETGELESAGDGLANDRLRATFADDGSVRSLIDVATGHEAAGGPLNQLVLFGDRWSYFDAWDIDIDYRSKRSTTLRADTTETFLDGPRAVRRSTYRHGSTLIVQDAVLTPGQPYLSFETRVEWHERWRMLRAEFRPAAWADRVACEIQFGQWHRSTRNDTPEERAQFEICAHRWIDLTSADGTQGFSLLNRTKFGHRVKEGNVSLNLLRSPVYPDPGADRGTHHFAYAVYPHAGGPGEARTRDLADDFNAPLVLTPGPPAARFLAQEDPVFTVEGEGVVLDTVTRSHDGRAVLLRLYEANGRPAVARVHTRLPVAGAAVTDLLETAGSREPVDLNELRFGPFELRTLRLERG